MATFDVDVNGVTYEVDAPDENTAWVWANHAHAQQNFQHDAKQPEQPGLVQQNIDAFKNMGMGALKGASDIGATILSPVDKLIGKTDRRQQLQDFFQENSNPDAGYFKAGELGSQIAGTAGAGGVLAKGASVIPVLAKFAPLLESGGFNLGNSGTNSAIANALMRTVAGAATGGAQAGMINPDSAGIGAAVGGATPLGVKAAGMVGNGINSALNFGANRMMKSALKPLKAARDSGDADVAIRTLLDEGLNVSNGGVDKLQRLLSGASGDVDNLVNSSTGSVGKQDVLDALQSSIKKFSTQATPTKDLEAIKGVGDEFATVWPDQIPVQAAHELKKGTYRVLNGKFGEQGSAATEAQKDLARGLKEQIEAAIPGIKEKNLRLSDYIKTMDVLTQATGRETNKDLLGLALLAGRPEQGAMMALDRNAVVKSLLARGLKKSANGVGAVGLPNFAQQYGLLGAPSVLATSP